MFLKKKFNSDALHGLTIYCSEAGKYLTVDTRDQETVEVHRSSRSGLTTTSSVFYEPNGKNEPLRSVRKDHFSLGLDFYQNEIFAVFDTKGHGSLGGEILFLVYRNEDSIFISENNKEGIEAISKFVEEGLLSNTQQIFQPIWLKFQYKTFSFGVNSRLATMIYFAANRAKSLDTMQGIKGGMMQGNLYKTDWLIIDLNKLYQDIIESGDLPRFVIPDTDENKYWVLADSDSDQSEAVLIDSTGVLQGVENYREYVLLSV